MKKRASLTQFEECLLERGEHLYTYFEVVGSISEVGLHSQRTFDIKIIDLLCKFHTESALRKSIGS